MKKWLYLVAACFIFAASFAGFGYQVITAKRVASGGDGISDDFSSDSSSNYTSIVNGISVGSGTAGGSTNWEDNTVYHKTSTGSNNHYAQAKIQVGTSSSATQTGKILLRCNGDGSSSTGYAVALQDTNRLNFWSFSGGTFTFISYWEISTDISAAETYVVKIQANGTTFSATFDVGGGNEESLGNKTDSTYSTGAYIGLGFGRGGGTDFRADDFEGDAL